ncbi:unnamed protein product [Cuscuta campestris]|uniref:Uncharacterized protein n=1 Tax=Cuscuta campestris TaxID=132261 RepID=A0A484MZW5_9ASTE|nr:unnamed protein product [Cuscuta campestris]VFQ93980.1 unnamed protein product [Cuscuta campestris]
MTSSLAFRSHHRIFLSITFRRPETNFSSGNHNGSLDSTTTAESIRIRDVFGPYLAASDTLSFYRNELKSGLKFIFPMAFTRVGRHGKL